MLAGAGAFGALAPAFAAAKKGGVKKSDIEILEAAQIAEALAVTTYTNIINTSPFFARIPDDDQGYLIAARQEEMSHFLLEESVTRKPSAFTTFYYPPKMFSDPPTTINTLVHARGRLHRRLPRRRTRLHHHRAAGHRGADHGHRERPPHARTGRRGDVSSTDGGPLAATTGAQKQAESIAPPNNNGYERTLKWTHISEAVEALLPFVEKKAAAKAGFETNTTYKFQPFTPKLPVALGEFHSFAG